MSNGEIEQINHQCIDAEDWSRACFPIGVKIKDQQSPWLELSKDDLYTLELILTKRLPSVGSTGHVTYLDPLVDHSESLKMLAKWCHAVRLWAIKHDSGVDP